MQYGGEPHDPTAWLLWGSTLRSVAKSFQVRVWRDLLRAWRALAAEERKRVEALLPGDAQLDDGRAA